jgi:hypothetical protein
VATVADGDCILTIARTLGIRDYRTLWEANSTLKTSRPNPNMLVVGDNVEEPPKKEKKKEICKTGKRWTFVISDSHPASLQIVLLGPDFQPLDGASWQLSAASQVLGSGVAAGGIINIKPLPLDTKSAVLKVTPKAAAPSSPPSAPSASPGTPAYPAPIKTEEFKDPVPASQPSDAFVEWELKIGSLPSHNHPSGVLARLHNLGAACDAGDSGAFTESSVKAYQRAFLNQSAPSGAPADIQDSVRDLHDKK